MAPPFPCRRCALPSTRLRDLNAMKRKTPLAIHAHHGRPVAGGNVAVTGIGAATTDAPLVCGSGELGTLGDADPLLYEFELALDVEGAISGAGALAGDGLFVIDAGARSVGGGEGGGPFRSDDGPMLNKGILGGAALGVSKKKVGSIGTRNFGVKSIFGAV